MEKLILEKYGSKHEITFEIGSYSSNGNLAIEMIDYDDGYPSSWSTLTVNIPGCEFDEDTACIDTNNNGNDIIDWLKKNKLGKLTGDYIPSGYCIYPVFKFDINELTKYI